MAAARTHYEILNVAPDAELVVIEAAYRALMKKYHPDQGGGATDGPSASDINRAYAALRDPERRSDYDHKEWIRQRDIQLAAYQPLPPPRASNFFGWGGWLVSAVLAGMIALMASKGGAPQLSEAEQARAATMAAPDMRSQPLPPEKSLVTPAEAADIRADAYAGRVDPPKPTAAPAAPTAPAPSPAAPAPVTIPAPEPTPRHPIYAARRGPPHRTHRVAARHDKDFLERQGYIY
jgi:curved DNA-binding protein CbpA